MAKLAANLSAAALTQREGNVLGLLANGDSNNLTDYQNKRFIAACAAAKAKAIDVWTIAIDSASSPQLQSCATNTSQAKFTSSGTDLGTIFSDIARKLAMLRLTV